MIGFNMEVSSDCVIDYGTTEVVLSSPAPMVKCVIGANYGDEGKGATVNYLTEKHKSKFVIRFNGGNQAGHTVKIKGKKPHIFHALGSGTFAGAKTAYTSAMLCNPLAILEESQELNLKSRVRVDPDCLIITPWDISINQFLEIDRDNARHGSCGLGINETVHRNVSGGPKLIYSDLSDEDTISKFYIDIIKWYRERLTSTITNKDILREALTDNTLFKMFYVFLKYVPSNMISTCEKVDEQIKASQSIIFEGAQGLLLDQNDEEHFPHVTRSNTGLKNIVTYCGKDLPISEIYYCTRPYLTRHGNGPILAGIECENLWDIGEYRDHTNVNNQYQGSVRYAHLDWKKLSYRIYKDTRHLVKQSGVKPPVIKLALTCLDQLHFQETYQFHYGDEIISFDSTDSDYFIKLIQDKVGLDIEIVDGRGVK
jgi:adenylosuccinate synthase